MLRQSRTVQCLLANSFKHLLGRMCAEVGVALQNCILGCAIHYGFYADGSLDCMLRSKIQRTKTCQKQVIFHVELHCLIRNNFHDFFFFVFSDRAVIIVGITQRKRDMSTAPQPPQTTLRLPHTTPNTLLIKIPTLPNSTPPVSYLQPLNIANLSFSNNLPLIMMLLLPDDKLKINS